MSRLLSSPELYKNIVWKTNPGLMYLAGCTRVFEAQAPWIVKYLVGEINFPDDPQPTINEWLNRLSHACICMVFILLQLRNKTVRISSSNRPVSLVWSRHHSGAVCILTG